MNRFFAKAVLALSALMLFSCASTPKNITAENEEKKSNPMNGGVSRKRNLYL